MNKIKTFFQKKEVKDNLTFIGVLIAIYVFVTLLFTYVPFFNQYHLYSIQTDSMQAVIDPGDIVLVKEVSPKDIKVDDIIAFHVDITSDGLDDVIVHYLDEIIEYDEDTLHFRTRPNISDSQDSWILEEHDIIGIYTYKVKNIGKVLLFLQSWTGKIVLLLDIIILSLVYDALFKKKDKKQEDLIIQTKE